MKRVLSFFLALIILLTPSVQVSASDIIFDESMSGYPSVLVNLETSEDWMVKVPLLYTINISTSYIKSCNKNVFLSLNYLYNGVDNKYLKIEPGYNITLHREGESTTDNDVTAGITGWDYSDELMYPTYFSNYSKVHSKGTGYQSFYVIVPDLKAGKWVGHVSYDINIVESDKNFYAGSSESEKAVEITDGEVDSYSGKIWPYNATEITVHDSYTDSNGNEVFVDRFSFSSYWGKVRKITFDRTRPFVLEYLPPTTDVITIDFNNNDVILYYGISGSTPNLNIQNPGKVLFTSTNTPYTPTDWGFNSDMYFLNNINHERPFFTQQEELIIDNSFHSDYNYLSFYTNWAAVPNLKKLTIYDNDSVQYYMCMNSPTLEEVYYDEPYMGRSSFAGCTKLKKVTLGPHVSLIDDTAFSGCTALEEVVIESNSLHCSESSFTGTPWYENMITSNTGMIYIGDTPIKFVPDGEVDEEFLFDYRTYDATSEHVINLSLVPHGTKKLKFSNKFRTGTKWKLVGSIADLESVDLTGINLENRGFYQNFPNCDTIIQPINVSGMNVVPNSSWVGGIDRVSQITQKFEFPSGSLQLSDLVGYQTFDETYFEIPSNLNYSPNFVSQNNPFWNFGKDGVFNEFRVASGNSSFKVVDGVLYSKDGTILYAVPKAKVFENNTFEIAEGVTKIFKGAFDCNESIEKVIFPDSYRNTTNVDNPSHRYFADWYAGQTSGTYAKLFEVKESNPNYWSESGIIYTKDKNTVAGVPYGYEGVLAFSDECEGSEFYPSTSSNLYPNITGFTIPEGMSLNSELISWINKFWTTIDYTKSYVTVTEGNKYVQVLPTTISDVDSGRKQLLNTSSTDLSNYSHSGWFISEPAGMPFWCFYDDTPYTYTARYNNTYTSCWANRARNLPAGKYKIYAVNRSDYNNTYNRSSLIDYAVANTDALKVLITMQKPNAVRTLKDADENYVNPVNKMYSLGEEFTVTEPDTLVFPSLLSSISSTTNNTYYIIFEKQE